MIDEMSNRICSFSQNKAPAINDFSLDEYFPEINKKYHIQAKNRYFEVVKS